MRPLALLIVLGTSLSWAADAKDDAVKKEMEKLDGAWQLVGGQERGKDADLKDLKVRYTFAGQKITIKFVELDLEKSLSFTIDPSKKPKEIDIMSKDETRVGIYALDGDTLKICTSKDKGDRPKEFATTADNGFALIILKREKK
jgi:uncharacterized protein (TIGR03067 family)